MIIIFLLLLLLFPLLVRIIRTVRTQNRGPPHGISPRNGRRFDGLALACGRVLDDCVILRTRPPGEGLRRGQEPPHNEVACGRVARIEDPRRVRIIRDPAQATVDDERVRAGERLVRVRMRRLLVLRPTDGSTRADAVSGSGRGRGPDRRELDLRRTGPGRAGLGPAGRMLPEERDRTGDPNRAGFLVRFVDREGGSTRQWSAWRKGRRGGGMDGREPPGSRGAERPDRDACPP